MTSACKMILVDTNVWLDYCLPFRAGHAVALQLVQRCLLGCYTMLAT